MLVNATDLHGHLDHGDGYVNDWVPAQPNTRFGLACELVSLVPATITFDNLVGDNGTPFTSYEESGLTITNTLQPWEVREHGKPPPSIIFFGLLPQQDTVGEVEIVSSSGLFALRSVDFYSSVTTVPYRIVGTVGTRQTFLLTGIAPHAFGAFVTVPNPNPALFETLTIRLTNSSSVCCRNPMGLDNISVIR